MPHLNTKFHRTDERVRLIESDLFNKVREQYDLIVFAPPRAIDVEQTKSRAREVMHERFFGQSDEVVNRELDSLINQRKRDQGKFDVDGHLLSRTLNEYKRHLTPRGKMLIMTEQDFTLFTNKSVESQTLHVGPWTADPIEGNFAIHKLN